MHDPTSVNRQGADVGPQYRSAIFYDGPEQLAAIEDAKERAEALWPRPIVTEITPLDSFFAAEPVHQDYFANNPESGYCQVVIEPKISHARQTFSHWLQQPGEHHDTTH